MRRCECAYPQRWTPKKTNKQRNQSKNPSNVECYNCENEKLQMHRTKLDSNAFAARLNEKVWQTSFPPHTNENGKQWKTHPNKETATGKCHWWADKLFRGKFVGWIFVSFFPPVCAEGGRRLLDIRTKVGLIDYTKDKQPNETIYFVLEIWNMSRKIRRAQSKMWWVGWMLMISLARKQ